MLNKSRHGAIKPVLLLAKKRTILNVWLLDNKDLILRLIGSVLAGVLALIVAQMVYRGAHLTADESSYIFQAHCFQDGVVARPMPPIPPVFERRLIILKEGLGWLSRYAPGYGLWLLPGVCINQPWLMSALAAALSVWFMTGCAKLLSLRVGPVLCLTLCSPYFIFMSGTLLSHPSSNLFGVIFLWSYLSWHKTRLRRYAVFCGASWAFMFLIRNYTALLIAVPIGLHALYDGLTNRNRRVWSGLLLAGLFAGIGVALLLFYNYLTVGDPWRMTYLAYNPDEAMGFGWRYRYGKYMNYTLACGLQHMWNSLLLLNRWLWGFPGALAILAGLLLAGWRWRWSPLLAGAAAAVWIGYIFFSNRTVDNIGPYYYFETFPFLVLIAALGLQKLGGWCRRILPRAAVWRWVEAILMVVLLGIGARFTWRAAGVMRLAMADKACLNDLINAAPENALIFLPANSSDANCEFMPTNPRGLRSNPLLVRDCGCEAVALAVAKCFPERQAYYLRYGTGEFVPFDTRRPLEIFLEAAQCGGYTGANEGIAGLGEVRVAREGQHPAHWMLARDVIWISPGRFRVGFELACSNVAPERPITLDIVVAGSDTVLAETKISGSQSWTTNIIACASTNAVLLEPRVHYGASGAVFVRAVCVKEEL